MVMTPPRPPVPGVGDGSARRDRDDKVGLYAAGGVPVYLLVDPVEDPPSVTVFSEPKEGKYRTGVRVDTGAAIRVPAPVDIDLDTSIFMP